MYKTAGEHSIANLEDAIEIFKTRNARYKDSFSRWGPVFQALFPDGIEIHSADDWNRITCLGHLIDKLIRYTTFFDEPHADSILDLGNYAFILRGLDAEIEHRDEPRGRVLTDEEMRERSRKMENGFHGIGSKR
jgi:hypothetical protein